MLLDRLRRRLFPKAPGRMEAIFGEIYRKNRWTDPESRSGSGSTLAKTRVIREELPSLLQNLDIRSLLDAPCGDLNWIQEIDSGVERYIGVDVVPDLIQGLQREFGNRRRRFVLADITQDPLPRCDAILCRDGFIHLSFDDIQRTLLNFRRSGPTWLLATSHMRILENEDIETGWWRSVNLQLPPFGFPEPERRITESAGTGKILGVWRLGAG